MKIPPNLFINFFAWLFAISQLVYPSKRDAEDRDDEAMAATVSSSDDDDDDDDDDSSDSENDGPESVSAPLTRSEPACNGTCNVFFQLYYTLFR